MKTLPAFVLALLLAFGGLTAQETQTIRPGQSIDGTLASDSKHEYTIDLDEDDWVYGEVNQKTVDVVVKILRPDGETIRTFDGPSRGAEVFNFTADTVGVFVIEVTSFEELEGEYGITVLRAEPLSSNPRRRMDQLMLPYTGDDKPGGVILVIEDGDVEFSKAWGMANLSHDIPFEVETISNIGSVTKQFTAMGILLLQAEGKLSLEDDIRKHIPELPDFGTPITLKNFLNHTSGYREIYNFLPMAGYQGEDAFPQEMAIRIVQRQPELQNAPNTEFNYNNTGFILVAMTVERVSGQSFPEYMKEKVFGPLGMNDTRVKGFQGEIIPGSAQGYVPAEDGGYRTARDLASSYGAGGIYTSARDLATWMLNYRDMTLGGQEAVGAITTSGILENGDTTGYGLGLGLREFRGQRIYAHTGGDVAHRTYFGYFPELESGVILMSNNASFDLSMGTDVAEAFFGDKFEEEASEEEEGPPPEAGFEGMPEDRMEAIAGDWIIEGPNLSITLTVEDGQLFADSPGQARVQLQATSDSTLTVQGVDASITVHWEEDGSANRATLHQNGDAPMRRVEAEELTEEDLADYVGRYFSEELETFYEITVEEGKLMANNFRMMPFELNHSEGDNFSSSAFFFAQVAFQRAGNGTVTGFTAANGRTRGVLFRRY
jgi:CubicO group peptidase (beta-lactamase class C family)